MKMLKRDPKERISAEELMREPWLAEEIQKVRERMGLSSPVEPAVITNEAKTSVKAREKRTRAKRPAVVDGEGPRRSKRRKTGTVDVL